MANSYKMTDKDIQQMIVLRASNAAIFTGRKNSAMRGWRAIKRELGLQGLISGRRLKKKWDNLIQKYKILKNPPEGVELKNPKDWPWYFLMDDARSGRLKNTAKVIKVLPIDDDKDSDLEDVLPVLGVADMAPIEHKEDVEMIDNSGKIEEPRSPVEIPTVTVRELESVASVQEPEAASTQQPATPTRLLYATLLPDSTAPVASAAGATSSPGIVVQAQTIANNHMQTVQPTTLLYATLLPDSTNASKSTAASSKNVALELAELQRKVMELKRQRQILAKKQAAFDKELINLEREKEQLNKDRHVLVLDKVKIERDRAMLDKNSAELEREKAELERDRIILERDRAYLHRDRAVFERDQVFLDKAKEDFERQRENLSPKSVCVSGSAEDKGIEATADEKQMDLVEKCGDVNNRVFQLLTSEEDQGETRERFDTLVQ